MEQKGQVRVKLKLKKGVLIKIICFIIIVFLMLFYYFNLTIKNIYIKGNNLIKDVKIIDTLEIGNYPKIFKLDKKQMESKLKENPLITDAKIKRNIFGRLDIEIDEATIILFYKYNGGYVTSSMDFIFDDNYYGYPTLINFTPDTVFENLVNGLNKIDKDIVRQINEIEYNPYKASDGSIIDEGRFLLKMNDGNQVLIDTVNIKNLNDYNKIYISIGMDQVKGTLYLDTITDDNIYFKSYEEMPAEQVNENTEENKSQQNNQPQQDNQQQEQQPNEPEQNNNQPEETSE